MAGHRARSTIASQLYNAKEPNVRAIEVLLERDAVIRYPHQLADLTLPVLPEAERNNV
jgi:hypothetical protein